MQFFRTSVLQGREHVRKKPHVRFDWTERRLKAVQRWVNGRFWRYTDFARYNSAVKTDRAAAANGDLFEAAAA
jgi:hypothetical protein